MKGLRRLLSILGILVLALGAVGVWPGARPAAADDQEPIKLNAGATEVREYDALVGTVPLAYNGAPGDARPNSCSQFTYCDNIPIELSVPSDLKNSDTEDYFLRLKIEWDNASGNNLDTYLYDAPYEATSAIASSATANMPETINLYRPEKPAYILVVMNRNGVNTGYKVTAAITIEPFGGAPDFGGVNENPGGPPTTQPPSNSDDDDDDFGFEDDPDDSFTPPPAAIDNGFGPPPPLAEVNRDDSLSALARQRGGFEDSLAAPNLTLQEEEPPPPSPVSGATVALLGGLIPASIVGGGVFWLRRRGGTASAGF